MNFRRWITALAVLAVFAAIASAQVVQPTPISCAVSASTNKAIRSEGVNELVGDVILTCTGGTAPTFETDGRLADRTTIVVDFGVPVTSRAVTGTGVLASEALLLIDEPNTGGGPLTNFGQNAIINACPVNGTCPAYYRVLQGFPVISVTADPAAAPLPAANAYQGTVNTASKNRVTFTNVPVVATGSQNVQRVYRITNVRVNAATAAAVTASVTVTPGTGSLTVLSLANNNVTVATPQASLTTSVTGLTTPTLCTPTAAAPLTNQSRANVALINFKENFSSAFKTRVLPLSTDAGSAQGNGASQKIATGSYTVGTTSLNSGSSESGFVTADITVSSVAAGLANSGTRLKANFKGLPSTATFYVSLNNVADFQTPVTAPTAVGGIASTSWATVIGVSGGVDVLATETTGTTPIPTATLFNANGAAGVLGVNAIPLTVTNGNAEVIWEVLNTQRDAAETLTFAVYAVYSNLSNPPAVGANGTIQLGYAPTTTDTGTWVPRFAAPSGGYANFFNVAPCQTTLLFPYVTNVLGYDTGIALSNTSKDPFNTATSEGTCAMNFYGTNAPAVFTTPSAVAAGSTYANTIGGMGAVNFSGYAIGVCNFQFAHGFAFITGPGFGGPNGTTMGYLATVLANTTGRGVTLVGESLGQ